MAATMEDNFKFGLDIHFAQRLAGNVTKIRERTVKKLRRWIAAQSAKQGDVGMEAELLRLWKGLFYCMWMCDKPVIQEEMADKIAELVHSFTTPKGAMAFFEAFLLTMKREWIGIDRLRMDKFFMFVRRCFRQVLVVLRNNNWEDSIVDQFLAVLCKMPLSIDPEASPDGLRYHFVDIYKEELARCAGQELTSAQVMKLIDPFCVLVTTTHNKTLLKVILRGFFQEIIDESDVGFPEESEDEGIDSGEEEKNEVDEEGGDKIKEENESSENEANEKEKKKKKKFVRKERPKLKYDYEALADRLFFLASQQTTPGFVRRKVYAMVKKFEDLKQGVFPDYNVGSLMDYQEDDDEDEQKYGDRPPPEKREKPRRRGGKQARERRLAKAAKQEAAREAQSASKRVADDLDEEEWMDEEVEEKEEDQKPKKRRRRKKKSKVHVEAEESTTGGSGENEKLSETEEGKKLEGDEPSKQEEIVESELIVQEKNTVEEMVTMEDTPGPGSDESDSGSRRKRGKKRKSDVVTNQVTVPVVDDNGDAKKESLTAGSEETKMATVELETAENASSNAGSDSKSSTKQKRKQRSNVGEVDRDQPPEVEKSVDKALKRDTIDIKEGSSAPKYEVQINLFKVDKLEQDSPAAKDTSSQLNTASTPKLSTGGKKKSERPFAVFQTVSTPPALVRRKVVRKEGEPKTEPLRKTKSRLRGLSEDTNSDHPTLRKRVKIELGLNKAHASKDYKKQLESSPGIPFDGAKKPIQSVLKTPSPKSRPPTKKKSAMSTFKTPKPQSPTKNKSATPTLKTPSPKIIKETGVKSGSKKRRSPKTAPNLRRSSRLKSIQQ